MRDLDVIFYTMLEVGYSLLIAQDHDSQGGSWAGITKGPNMAAELLG